MRSRLLGQHPFIDIPMRGGPLETLVCLPLARHGDCGTTGRGAGSNAASRLRVETVMTSRTLLMLSAVSLGSILGCAGSQPDYYADTVVSADAGSYDGLARYGA